LSLSQSRFKNEETQSAQESQKDLIKFSGQIFEEIGSLKSLLHDVSDNVQFLHSGSLGSIFGTLYKNLRKAGISEQFALNIAGKLSARGNIHSIQEAIIEARPLLTENIKTFQPFAKGDKRKIFAFIGPTGSGKTTALTKLAIISKLVMESNSFIISADSHKVGGAEQLQTFASIASIPFATVYNKTDLSDALEGQLDKDFIFIDTTGRSPNNKESLNEMKEMLESVKIDVTFLVVSFTTSQNTFANTINSYSIFNPDALILTKLDEAATIGGIITALKEISLPLAYYTTGQKIPEDIEPASKKKLNSFVLQDFLDKN
jgi:flagellar biosynthesis protein FlhF